MLKSWYGVAYEIAMERIQLEKSKLISEIKETLISWFNKKPEIRNVAFLSRETGVTDSSIRRLLNNSVKIADDSIFKILSFVFGAQGYDELFCALGEKKEIQKWFQRTYAYLKKSPVLQEYKLSSDSDVITNSVISLSVFALISSNSKITQTQVKEQFGAIGEYELEKLIENNIVSISNENFLTVKENKVMLSKEQVVTLLPEIARMFFKKEHAYNGRILSMESISKEGYNKMLDAVDNFNEQITNLAKEYPGAIPVVTAGFFDTLTTVPYFEGGKNESSN